MKKINETDLLIEEYDSQFSYQKKSNLNISFNRIAFIFFIFVVLSIIFSIKALFLGSLEKKIKKNIIESEFRSSIIDRNGNLIAKSIITNNVGIDPKLVIDKDKLLLNLKLIFPNKKKNELFNLYSRSYLSKLKNRTFIQYK